MRRCRVPLWLRVQKRLFCKIPLSKPSEMSCVVGAFLCMKRNAASCISYATTRTSNDSMFHRRMSAKDATLFTIVLAPQRKHFLWELDCQYERFDNPSLSSAASPIAVIPY